MNADKNPSLDAIAQQAAQWFARNRDGDLSPAQREQFSQWLAESPVHVREYLAITETWGTLQSTQAWPPESADALLQQLRGNDQGNVVMLSSRIDAPPDSFAAFTPPRSLRRRWPAIFTAAASLAIVPVALVIAWWMQMHGDVYSTQRGEQRSVVLRDGSVVQLNTLTRMVVHFDDTERRIELPDGEAFFRVARDPARPFYVETPYAVVRAVGTEFNVYARARSTQVAVVEGKVQVAARVEAEERIDAAMQNMPRPIALSALQSVDIGRDGAANPPAVRPQSPDAQVATAWIQRRLVFQNDRVDRAAEEFNRYNQMQIQVDDPSVAALRISGVFNADDPMMLVKYLEKIQHVKVTPTAETVILTSRI